MLVTTRSSKCTSGIKLLTFERDSTQFYVLETKRQTSTDFDEAIRASADSERSFSMLVLANYREPRATTRGASFRERDTPTTNTKELQ